MLNTALPDEGPWRLLGMAVVWLALASFVGFAVVVAIVVASVLHNHQVAALDGPKWDFSIPALVVLATLPFEAMMLLGCRWRGQRIGRGDWKGGLAIQPAANLGQLALLGMAILLVVPAWSHFLSRFEAVTLNVTGLPIQPEQVANRAVWLLLMAIICVGAPVTEELFFRGWLWTGLRRHWSLLAVSLVTSAFWLVLHTGDGWGKPLFILPAAVILPLARQRCGSIWAPMALHALNNIAVTATALGLPHWR